MNHASAQHFNRLRALIKAEEVRTGQHARMVRISAEIADNLVAMNVGDWEASGFSSKDSDRIAGKLFPEGRHGVNGLSVSIFGPLVSVSEDLAAPDVEIIEGTLRTV